jgi:hypothetical protein
MERFHWQRSYYRSLDLNESIQTRPMVEEKQSSGLISQVQSSDGGMVKDGMPNHTEVEPQIMGDDGPNDVRVRH